MASFHQTIIVGNLGRDPETRHLNSGDTAANFSVAVTEQWKDKSSGEKREKTTWYRVSMFGRLAEVAGQYLKKGSQVQIIGRMEERKWTDKDSGAERSMLELRADQMLMLGSAGGNSNTGSGSQTKPSNAAPASKQASMDDYEDDIPF